MITYETLLADQAKHRAAFGQMLRDWRAANGWRTTDPARLAETRGFLPVPYRHWRWLEQGCWFPGQDPKVTFMALGELNQHAPVPLGDWDGETTRWGPVEFWACYCGLRPVPARWRQIKSGGDLQWH